MEDFADTFAVLVANETTMMSKTAKSNYKVGTTCDAKYQYIKALLIKHIGEDKVVTKQAKKFLGEKVK